MALLPERRENRNAPSELRLLRVLSLQLVADGVEELAEGKRKQRVSGLIGSGRQRAGRTGSSVAGTSRAPVRRVRRQRATMKVRRSRRRSHEHEGKGRQPQARGVRTKNESEARTVMKLYDIAPVLCPWMLVSAEVCLRTSGSQRDQTSEPKGSKRTYPCTHSS
jgi:hypothetical protein